MSTHMASIIWAGFRTELLAAECAAAYIPCCHYYAIVDIAEIITMSDI